MQRQVWTGACIYVSHVFVEMEVECIYASHLLVYIVLMMCDVLCNYIRLARDVMGCPATQAQHRRVRVQHRGRGGSYADRVPIAQAGGGRHLLGALHEPLLRRR